MTETLSADLASLSPPAGFGLGFGVGLIASALFFAGLAWGVRHAVASSRPGTVLLLSFALRCAILMGLGAWLIRATDPLWTLAGYLLSFLLARMLVVRLARATGSADATARARGN